MRWRYGESYNIAAQAVEVALYICAAYAIQVSIPCTGHVCHVRLQDSRDTHSMPGLTVPSDQYTLHCWGNDWHVGL